MLLYTRYQFSIDEKNIPRFLSVFAKHFSVVILVFILFFNLLLGLFNKNIKFKNDLDHPVLLNCSNLYDVYFSPKSLIYNQIDREKFIILTYSNWDSESVAFVRSYNEHYERNNLTQSIYLFNSRNSIEMMNNNKHFRSPQVIGHMSDGRLDYLTHRINSIHHFNEIVKEFNHVVTIEHDQFDLLDRFLYEQIHLIVPLTSIFDLREFKATLKELINAKSFCFLQYKIILSYDAERFLLKTNFDERVLINNTFMTDLANNIYCSHSKSFIRKLFTRKNNKMIISSKSSFKNYQLSKALFSLLKISNTICMDKDFDFNLHLSLYKTQLREKLDRQHRLGDVCPKFFDLNARIGYSIISKCQRDKSDECIDSLYGYRHLDNQRSKMKEATRAIQDENYIRAVITYLYYYYNGTVNDNYDVTLPVDAYRHIDKLFNLCCEHERTRSEENWKSLDNLISDESLSYLSESFKNMNCNPQNYLEVIFVDDTITQTGNIFKWSTQIDPDVSILTYNDTVIYHREWSDNLQAIVDFTRSYYENKEAPYYLENDANENMDEAFIPLNDLEAVKEIFTSHLKQDSLVLQYTSSCIYSTRVLHIIVEKIKSDFPNIKIYLIDVYKVSLSWEFQSDYIPSIFLIPKERPGQSYSFTNFYLKNENLYEKIKDFIKSALSKQLIMNGKETVEQRPTFSQLIEKNFNVSNIDRVLKENLRNCHINKTEVLCLDELRRSFDEFLMTCTTMLNKLERSLRRIFNQINHQLVYRDNFKSDNFEFKLLQYDVIYKLWSEAEYDRVNQFIESLEDFYNVLRDTINNRRSVYTYLVTMKEKIKI